VLISVPLASVIFIPLYIYRRLEDSRQSLPEPVIRQLPHARCASIIRNKSLMDIGFVAFWGKNQRAIYQTQSIPTSVEALQPYIQIHFKRYAQFRIDFEIMNDGGERVFYQTIHTWMDNGNFVTPTTRFRLENVPTGEWKLRVYVDHVLWANHRFTWVEDTVKGVEGNIRADGEVNEELLGLLSDDYSERMSLDELLSESDAKDNKRENKLDP
jgi:hypothetical protein